MNRLLPCEHAWGPAGRIRRLVHFAWWGHRNHSCVRWTREGQKAEHTEHVCQCGAQHLTPRHKRARHGGSLPPAVVLAGDGTKDGPVTVWIDEPTFPDRWTVSWPGIDEVQAIAEEAVKPDPVVEFRRQWLDDVILAHAEALSAPVSDRRPGGRQGPTETPERPAGAQRAGKQQGSSENPTIGQIAEAAGLDFDQIDTMDPRKPQEVVRYYAEETRRT